MIRQLLHGLGIIVLLTGSSFTVQAWGADATVGPKALQALNAARVTMDRANLDYQMFKTENQNPAYAENMQEHLDDLGRQMDRVADALAGSEHLDALEPIADHMGNYVRLLQENYQAILDGGYEVLAISDQMMSEKKEAQRLMSELFDTLAENVDVEPRVREYLDLSFEMQRMAARYVEYASSISGVAFRDQSDEKTVDVLAQDFSARLSRLSDKDLPAGPATLIKDVRRKWTFIEGSMMNYMQNQVAFLVYRYSNNIVDGLLNAARELMGGDEETIDAGPGHLPLPPGIPAAAN